MNAYQCDRCFKFFTIEGVRKPEDTVITTARRSYRYVRIKYGIATDTCLFDLCPSCEKSLKHWFQNPYIDEEKKENPNEQ